MITFASVILTYPHCTCYQFLPSCPSSFGVLYSTFYHAEKHHLWPSKHVSFPRCSSTTSPLPTKQIRTTDSSFYVRTPVRHHQERLEDDGGRVPNRRRSPGAAGTDGPRAKHGQSSAWPRIPSLSYDYFGALPNPTLISFRFRFDNLWEEGANRLSQVDDF